MNRWRFLTLLLLLLAAEVTGCGSPAEESSAEVVKPLPEAIGTAVVPEYAPAETTAPEDRPLEVPNTQDRVMGQFDVGGYKLNILCFGAGEPTVIVEGSVGIPGTYWTGLTELVKHSTRVCQYDRAGVGSSDFSANAPRSSGDIARELHTLLRTADVPGPYILVGHRFGALIGRMYAYFYPEEVSGLLWLDPWFAGELEMLAAVNTEYGYTPPPIDFAHQEGGLDMTRSYEEAAALDGLGDIPLRVLSAGLPLTDPSMPEDWRTAVWSRTTALQVGLADLSSSGRHAIVNDATSVTIPFMVEQLAPVIIELVELARVPEA